MRSTRLLTRRRFGFDGWTGQPTCPANGLAPANAPGRPLTRLLARGVAGGQGLERACMGRRGAQEGGFRGANEIPRRVVQAITPSGRTTPARADSSSVNRPQRNARHQTWENRQKTLAHSSLRGIESRKLKRFTPSICPPGQDSGGRIGGRLAVRRERNAMIHGTVCFHASCPGIEFDGIEFTPPHQGVHRACVSSNQAEGVILRVTVKNVASIEHALAQSQEVATFVNNLLCFRLATHVPTFGLVEHSLIDDNDDPLTRHVGQTMGFSQTFYCCRAIGHDECQQIHALLERDDHAGYAYYEMFRSALGLTDPLSRFMGIYNIVLQLSGDRQEHVDTFVLSVQPKVPTHQPHGRRSSGTRETLYTRLRNEVGHVRSGTTIEATKSEMATHIGGLIEVAKELIGRQPQAP